MQPFEPGCRYRSSLISSYKSKGRIATWRQTAFFDSAHEPRLRDLSNADQSQKPDGVELVSLKSPLDWLGGSLTVNERALRIDAARRPNTAATMAAIVGNAQGDGATGAGDGPARSDRPAGDRTFRALV